MAVQALSDDDISGLEPLGPLLHIKADGLTLGKGLEAAALNGTEMNEEVSTAIRGGDETETF